MTIERIRTTISLTPEALEIFKRMAQAGNMSVSRCMGDWLTDTADAAEMITLKMEEASKAPMRFMREMRALVAGMGNEIDSLMPEVRAYAKVQRQSHGGVRASGPGRAIVEAPPSAPPSSNTGVLVPPVPPSPIPQRNKTIGRKA